MKERSGNKFLCIFVVSHLLSLFNDQEYNACDGAHEPGRSYGGACVNSMLKVLYDDANNIANLAEAEAASDALFDDDTEDDDDSSYLGKSFKSCVSMEYATPTNNTISWADLLRKMKVEVSWRPMVAYTK